MSLEKNRGPRQGALDQETETSPGPQPNPISYTLLLQDCRSRYREAIHHISYESLLIGFRSAYQDSTAPAS